MILIRCEHSNTVTAVCISKVWPMGVTSTVSRLPITVKVVPVSSNEEQGGGEQQQRGELEEERSQQQNSQTQGDEAAAQTGDTGLIHLTDVNNSRTNF